MPKPKSIILRVEVDEAQKAHNCQHNPNHRLRRGDKRLKVWNQRSADHYCVECALNIIERDMAKLRQLARQLQSEVVTLSEADGAQNASTPPRNKRVQVTTASVAAADERTVK